MSEKIKDWSRTWGWALTTVAGLLVWGATILASRQVQADQLNQLRQRVEAHSIELMRIERDGSTAAQKHSVVDDERETINARHFAKLDEQQAELSRGIGALSVTIREIATDIAWMKKQMERGGSKP